MLRDYPPIAPSDGPPVAIARYDEAAMRNTLYPTSERYKVREYQRECVLNSLVMNSFVALDTGMGKTFIASAVMMNFYKWFPEGCIVFLAPTVPLVHQQYDAHKSACVVSQDALVKLVGVQSRNRHKAWGIAGSLCIGGPKRFVDRRAKNVHRARIFFSTPQILRNDLVSGVVDARRITLIVFDEAHRALGNYAYVGVMNEMLKRNWYFRVLALSATPGNDEKAIQTVLQNLCITRLKVFDQDDSDVAMYTHEKDMDVFVLKVPDFVTVLQVRVAKLLLPLLERLVKILGRRVLSGFGRGGSGRSSKSDGKQQQCVTVEDAMNVQFFHLMMHMRQIKQHHSHLPDGMIGLSRALLGAASALARCREVVATHGVEALLSSLEAFGEDKRKKVRLKTATSPQCQKLLSDLRHAVQRAFLPITTVAIPGATRTEDAESVQIGTDDDAAGRENVPKVSRAALHLPNRTKSILDIALARRAARQRLGFGSDDEEESGDGADCDCGSSGSDHLCLIEDMARSVVAGDFSRVVSSDSCVHPKVLKTMQLVLEHFLGRASCPTGGTEPVEASSSSSSSSMTPRARRDSRIMVFCELRDMVASVVQGLSLFVPIVRPVVLVGTSRSSASGAKSGDSHIYTTSRNMRGGAHSRLKRATRGDQERSVAAFRLGTFNVMVCTCIGEEGLDFGAVDLTICLDTSAAPTRTSQRHGRTGRSRRGRVVTVLMEGLEERRNDQSGGKHKRMQKSIRDSSKFLLFANPLSLFPLERQGRAVDVTLVDVGCQQDDARLGGLGDERVGHGDEGDDSVELARRLASSKSAQRRSLIDYVQTANAHARVVEERKGWGNV